MQLATRSPDAGREISRDPLAWRHWQPAGARTIFRYQLQSEGRNLSKVRGVGKSRARQSFEKRVAVLQRPLINGQTTIDCRLMNAAILAVSVRSLFCVMV